MAVLLFLAVFFGFAFLRTWILMLLLGAAHAEISTKIPALGFWPTFLFSVLLGIIAAPFRSRGKS